MPFVYKQEKKFPVIIPVVLLVLWMAGSAWYWVCEVKGRCGESVVIDRVTCPVLWIHAQGDVAASREAAQAAVDRMPAAKKEAVALAKSNHHIFWDYEREIVETAVVDFLGALP